MGALDDPLSTAEPCDDGYDFAEAEASHALQLLRALLVLHSTCDDAVMGSLPSFADRLFGAPTAQLEVFVTLVRDAGGTLPWGERLSPAEIEPLWEAAHELCGGGRRPL